MNLSVIIAHYQEPEHLVATIRSIRETAPMENVEIVVVDDGGFYPENTGAKCIVDTSKKENIRFIAVPERRGHSYCREIGAQHADGDWLMFTDAHMVFLPHWFDRFKGHAEISDSKTLFCGPYLSSTETDPVPQFFWGARHYFWEKKPPHGGDWDFFGVTPLTLEQTGVETVGLTAFEVPAVIGANYFLSKDWFRRIGGLPCQMGWTVDEWPLSVKTWLAGGTVRLMPNVCVRHVLYKSGKGKDGYGKQMTQGHLLFNKLSVAFQVLPADLYEKFLAALPLSRSSPKFIEAVNLMNRNASQLCHWRNYLKGVFLYDVDWLCAKFNLAHPEDLGAET